MYNTQIALYLTLDEALSGRVRELDHRWRDHFLRGRDALHLDPQVMTDPDDRQKRPRPEPFVLVEMTPQDVAEELKDYVGFLNMMHVGEDVRLGEPIFITAQALKEIKQALA